MNKDELQNIYNNLVEIVKESKNTISLAPMDECYVVNGVQFCVPVLGLQMQGVWDLETLIKRKTKTKFNMEYGVSASPKDMFETEDDAMYAYLSGDMELGIYFDIPMKPSVKKYKEIAF